MYFLSFIQSRVTLVFATQALRNLNHMLAAARWDLRWVAATPFTYHHPRIVRCVEYTLIGSCDDCSNTPTPNLASSMRTISRRISGTTAPIRKSVNTKRWRKPPRIGGCGPKIMSKAW